MKKKLFTQLYENVLNESAIPPVKFDMLYVEFKQRTEQDEVIDIKFNIPSIVIRKGLFEREIVEEAASQINVILSKMEEQLM